MKKRLLRDIVIVIFIVLLSLTVGCDGDKEIKKSNKTTLLEETTMIESSLDNVNEEKTTENFAEDTTAGGEIESNAEKENVRDSIQTTVKVESVTSEKQTTAIEQNTTQKQTTKKEETTKKEQINIGKEVVPKGCIYWQYVGKDEVKEFSKETFNKKEYKQLNEGAVMPKVSLYDVYQTDEYYYIYTDAVILTFEYDPYNQEIWHIERGWNVADVVEDKETYGKILGYIGEKPVVAMIQTFYNNDKIVSAPEIPKTINDMVATFAECDNLISASSIPGNVREMYATFSDCSSLKSMPNISFGVTDMTDAFCNCDSLVATSAIPKSVVGLTGCFSYCDSLVVAPTIPDSVEYMSATFLWCSNLKTAPIIPVNVKYMNGAFSMCGKLTGKVEINSKNIAGFNGYEGCFENVDFIAQQLTLTGTCDYLKEFRETGIN